MVARGMRGRGRRRLPTLWALVIALVCTLWGATPVSAAELASAPVLAGAPAGAETLAEPTYGAPADHPVARTELSLPPPPSAFNVYRSGWILFAYPPDMRERVQPLIREADAFRHELAVRLGQPILDDVSVYVARTPGEMSTLAPEGAPYPAYASGVAYSQIGLVLLTITPEHANASHDLLEIFKHELAHVALYDALGKRHSVPRWFNEGFAVHASGESSLARLQTLWTATLSGNLMPISRLEAGFPADGVTAGLAYAQSADLVRYLMRQSDRERFSALIGRMRRGEAFDVALGNAYGLDRATLEYEWREDVARRYSFWPVFFSGSLVWMGMIGLFVLGWRKRRKRARATLDRWTREEASEDARRARLRAASGASAEIAPRVHIVFPAATSTLPELPAAAVGTPPRPPEGDVPKVEHDGNWHTLH
jgi:hypothetical protein